MALSMNQPASSDDESGMILNDQQPLEICVDQTTMLEFPQAMDPPHPDQERVIEDAFLIQQRDTHRHFAEDLNCQILQPVAGRKQAAHSGNNSSTMNDVTTTSINIVSQLQPTAFIRDQANTQSDTLTLSPTLDLPSVDTIPHSPIHSTATPVSSSIPSQSPDPTATNTAGNSVPLVCQGTAAMDSSDYSPFSSSQESEEDEQEKSYKKVQKITNPVEEVEKEHKQKQKPIQKKSQKQKRKHDATDNESEDQGVPPISGRPLKKARRSRKGRSNCSHMPESAFEHLMAMPVSGPPRVISKAQNTAMKSEDATTTTGTVSCTSMSNIPKSISADCLLANPSILIAHPWSDLVRRMDCTSDDLPKKSAPPPVELDVPLLHPITSQPQQSDQEHDLDNAIVEDQSRSHPSSPTVPRGARPRVDTAARDNTQKVQDELDAEYEAIIAAEAGRDVHNRSPTHSCITAQLDDRDTTKQPTAAQVSATTTPATTDPDPDTESNPTRTLLINTPTITSTKPAYVTPIFNTTRRTTAQVRADLLTFWPRKYMLPNWMLQDENNGVERRQAEQERNNLRTGAGKKKSKGDVVGAYRGLRWWGLYPHEVTVRREYGAAVRQVRMWEGKFSEMAVERDVQVEVEVQNESPEGDAGGDGDGDGDEAE